MITVNQNQEKTNTVRMLFKPRSNTVHWMFTQRNIPYYAGKILLISIPHFPYHFLYLITERLRIDNLHIITS